MKKVCAVVFFSLFVNGVAMASTSSTVSSIVSGASALLAGGGQSERVTITSSSFDNDFEANDSVLWGNGGIKLSGEEINVTSSTFKSKARLDDSIVFGNVGIEIGNDG